MAWIAFAVLCASVLIDLALYIISHHSTSFLLLAGFLVVYALGGIAAGGWVTARLTPDRLTRLRERLARLRGVYLAVGLLVTFAFGLGLRPEFIYTHSAIMLGVGFALGYDLLYGNTSPLSRTWVIAASLIVVIVTLIRIYALSYYPSIYWVDESWVLGWALSYVKTGHFSDMIMYHAELDIQRFMLPVAWWISLFGSGYWQVRLFFFLLIIPLILMTARAAHNLFGSGWVTALVMFCSVIVMFGARIRHDIGLALAVAGSIWLYSEAIKRERNGLHLFAGVVMGWGLFAHYHAVGFGIALTISLYGPRYVERLRRGQWLPERAFWFYALGGLLGAATVVVLQILPDWDGFIARRQPRNPQSLGKLFDSFFAHWANVLNFSKLEFILIVSAIPVALWRRTRTDITLVLLVITMHIALALQAAQAWEYYVIPLTPVYALLIASLFRSQPQGRNKAIALAALVLLPNLGLSLQTPLEHVRERSSLQLPTPPAAQWILDHLPPTKIIAAEQYYYLFLNDYPFDAIDSWDNLPPQKPFTSPTAMWDQINPDAVIVDQNLAWCCADQPIHDLDYLQTRGYVKVAEFIGDQYPIQIFEKSDEIK
ncbi:MAG: glycosyltransferase family 39 protein [Chloroflexota bacterium]